MLGSRLATLRGKRTQQEVATALGITRSRYSHYETGRNEPDQSMLQKLATYHNCSIDYLIGRTDDPMKDLPEEARKSIEDFIEFTRHKYNRE